MSGIQDSSVGKSIVYLLHPYDGSLNNKMCMLTKMFEDPTALKIGLWLTYHGFV